MQFSIYRGGIDFTEQQRPNENRLETVYESINETNKKKKRMIAVYFSGTYIDERDAPIPGVPCLTGLFVTANSPK